MKSYQEYQDEKESSKGEAEHIYAKVKAIFPNNYVSVTTSHLGGVSYFVSYANVRADANQLDILNSVHNIRFVCHGVENNKFSWELMQKSWQLKELKFRKISGNTFQDVTDKLISWIEKNKEVLA